MRLTIKEELKQAKVTFKPEETKEAIKVATILRDTDNITLNETDRKTYICFSYNMDKEDFKKEYKAAKYMVYEGITPNNKFVALPGKEFNTLHTDNKVLSCRKETYATTPLYKLIISNRVVYITKTLSDLNKFVNANWTKLDTMEPMSDHDVAVWSFLANNFEVYIKEDGTTEIPMDMARTFGGYTYEYKEEIKKLGKYTFDYVHKEWIDKNFVYPEEFEGFIIKTWEYDQLGRFYSFDVKPEADMATETQKEQLACHHIVNPCTPQGQNPMQQPQSNTTIELPATAKVFGHGYSTPCKYDLDAHHTIKMSEKTTQEIAEDRKVLVSKNPYKYPKILENYEVLYMEFGYINTAKFNNFWDLLPIIFCLYTTDDLSDTIYNGHAGDYDFYDLEYFAQEVSYTENDCTDEWKIYSNGDIYLGDDLVLQHI